MPRVPENLSHTIDQWTDDGQTLVEIVARAKTYDVAVAAFDAVVKADPHSFIRMSHGSRIIRERPATPWKPSFDEQR